MKLELELDSEPVAPGGDLSGRVNVLEGGESRSLTLTLTFHEKTADYAVTPLSSDVVLHEGNLTAGESYDFTFTLHDDAPPSVKCKHSELYWELAITSDEHGLDTHVTRRLEVIARP